MQLEGIKETVGPLAEVLAYLSCFPLNKYKIVKQQTVNPVQRHLSDLSTGEILDYIFSRVNKTKSLKPFKRLCGALRLPWISVPNIMVIGLIVVEIFQYGQN